MRFLWISRYARVTLFSVLALACADCDRQDDDQTAVDADDEPALSTTTEDTAVSSSTRRDTMERNVDPIATPFESGEAQLRNPIADLVRPQACITSRTGGLRPARGVANVIDATEVDTLIAAIRSGDLAAIFAASNSVRVRSLGSEGTLPIHAAITGGIPLAVWNLARLGSPLNPVDGSQLSSIERVFRSEPPLARSLDPIELPWSRVDTNGRTTLAQLFATRAVDSFLLRVEPQVQGEGPIITKGSEESRELLESALADEIFVLFLLRENPACFLVWAKKIAARAVEANWTRTIATLALYDPQLAKTWTPVRIDYEFWDQVFRSWLHTPEYRDVVPIETFVEILGSISATFGPVRTSDDAVNRSIVDLSRQTGAAIADALFVALQPLQASAIDRPNGPRSHQRAIVHHDDIYFGDDVVGYRVVQAPHPFVPGGNETYELAGDATDAVVHYDTRSAHSGRVTAAASDIRFQFLPTDGERVPRIGGRQHRSVLVTARRRKFIPGAEGIATVSLGSLATSHAWQGDATVTSVYRESADADGPVATYARTLVETELYTTPKASSQIRATLAPGQNAAVVEARLGVVNDDDPRYWYLLRNEYAELGWAPSDRLSLLPLESWPAGALAAALGAPSPDVGNAVE